MKEALLQFAEHEISLSARQSDGATLREHLESLANQTGEMPQELEAVDCPEPIRYLWGYFTSMSKRRTWNGGMANPISNQEMQAWAQPRGIALSAFDVEALDDLETMYIEHQSKAAAGK